MELSVIIPARNEQFLSKTIEDVLVNMRGNTEVIAVCDGNWPDPPIKDDPRVHLIHHSQSIGQRAATNEAARMSQAKYLMKLDAHCSVDEGFDVKMMKDMQDDWTMIPRLFNLHVFNWLCKCGHSLYQGPTPLKCAKCGDKMEREMIWKPRLNRRSDFMLFDSELRFGYWSKYEKRPESKGDIVDVMSTLGACWMLTRKKYFELNICDEAFGSWGQQGTEVACKTWLSGGRLVVNKKTFYSHAFRTQGGDWGFPYPNPGIEKARAHCKDLFLNNKWDKAIHPLSWLLEKFWPIPGWTEEDLTKVRKAGDVYAIGAVLSEPTKPLGMRVGEENKQKGMVYYTDNRLDEKIMRACQSQIMKCCNGYKIVSVSLKPIKFGENVVLPLDRGYLTMFKQILAGIEASKSDIIFLVEHDLLYHPSHFDFIPEKKDVFYYNENRWFVDAETGRALFYNAKSTSGLCAYRDLLLEHYRKRVERVEREGFTRRLGFEPGNHPYPRGVDNYGSEAYFSKFPNIDIRHKKNLTPSRWSQDEFRSKKNLYAWKEADEVPFWGRTKGRFEEILNAVSAS